MGGDPWRYGICNTVNPQEKALTYRYSCSEVVFMVLDLEHTQVPENWLFISQGLSFYLQTHFMLDFGSTSIKMILS